jgi:hypothetical protein
LLGWNNMSELTRFGMPGAFAHGTFDTWTPGYLMFIAAMHNGTSRLYETFGNGGADTVDRTVSPREYARTWYRQNPPLPKASWSQRNNNNYQQTALLTALSYYGENSKLFLRNFYLKAKRSVPAEERGPARLRVPSDDPRPRPTAPPAPEAGCEVSRHAAFTAECREEEGAARDGDGEPEAQGPSRRKRRRRTRRRPNPGSSPRGATSSAWISPIAGLPTRFWTTSTGARTIRRRIRTMTPAGPSASCSTCRSCA